MFKTQYNAEDKAFQTNRHINVKNKISMTIPDQSMTVSELVERNKRGLPLGGAKVPIWEEDPENNYLPDVKRLDLAEIQDMKDQAQSIIDEKREQLDKIEKKKQTNKVKQLEEEITKLKNSQKNEQTGALAGNFKPVTSNITE